jgi:hypothetical protein
VLTKGYGKLLIEGLPPASRVSGSWRQVLTACEDFFAGHGIEASG